MRKRNTKLLFRKVELALNRKWCEGWSLMSYQITITEKRQVSKKVGKEWCVVAEKEVERDMAFCRNGEPETRLESVYGYTPEIEKFVTEEREILKQTVETLDLAAVIKAINQL